MAMEKLALSLPSYGEIRPPEGVPTGGFTNSSTGNEIIDWALGLVFAFGAILSLMFIVWGAIQWLTSQGDKEKIAEARHRITFAVIGLVVLVLSVLIINIFLRFFGARKISDPGQDSFCIGNNCILAE